MSDNLTMRQAQAVFLAQVETEPTDDEELIKLQEWEQRIRNETLEEAARVVERNWGTVSVSAAGTELPSWPGMAAQLAAAIRALKEKE